MFLAASRCETKTSRKEQNPGLIFPQASILRTATVEIIFRVVPRIAALVLLSAKKNR